MHLIPYYYVASHANTIFQNIEILIEIQAWKEKKTAKWLNNITEKGFLPLFIRPIFFILKLENY